MGGVKWCRLAHVIGIQRYWRRCAHLHGEAKFRCGASGDTAGRRPKRHHQPRTCLPLFGHARERERACGRWERKDFGHGSDRVRVEGSERCALGDSVADHRFWKRYRHLHGAGQSRGPPGDKPRDSGPYGPYYAGIGGVRRSADLSAERCLPARRRHRDRRREQTFELQLDRDVQRLLDPGDRGCEREREWERLVHVQANEGAKRDGTLLIAGETFTVTQAAGECINSISPLNAAVQPGGGTGTVAVTARSDCSWTATPNPGATWIQVTSGASGQGNGTVSYAVQANNTPYERTGTILIAGQTFTVTQRRCTLRLRAQAEHPVGPGGRRPVQHGARTHGVMLGYWKTRVIRRGL